MKTLTIAIIFIFITIPMTFAQTVPGSTADGNPAANQSGIMAASNSLRILSPTVGQSLGSTSLTVRYQLTDEAASAAPSPTYRVQLDSRDPEETLGTELNFTGLAPGDHTIIVELVDANHTVIGGSRAMVHFKTFTPKATSEANPKSQITGQLSPPPVVKAKLPLPAGGPTDQLPSAGGELPLLSMVGFGVLVGGVISAMRTRR